MTESIASVQTRRALIAAAIAELSASGRADISLRAVARRAGVSHAAPAYFFRDRAGLLTAVAATGFTDLTARLEQAAEAGLPDMVAGYGQVYVEFALERAALFDLMFGSPDLHQDDPDLVHAREAALGALDAAAAPTGSTATARSAPADATLVRWAFAHGVAVLLRTGALQTATRAGHDNPAQLAHRIITAFTAEVSSS